MRKTLVHFVVGCLLAAPVVQADDKDDGSYLAMSLAELLDVEIVTSARVKQKLSASHSTVKVITAEEIRLLPVTTLGELFKLFVPGMDVRVEHDKLIKNYIGIRGLSGDSYAKRMLFLLDGRPLNYPVDGDFDTDMRLPLSAIQRIEIIRGPGSSLYGANAFQGIVNVITGTPKGEEMASFSGRYGSYDNYGVSAVVQRKVAKDVELFVAAEGDGASEYGVARDVFDLPSTVTDYGEGFGAQDVKGRLVFKGLSVSAGFHHDEVNDSAKGQYVVDSADPKSIERANSARSAFGVVQFEKALFQNVGLMARSYYTSSEKDTRYSAATPTSGVKLPTDFELSERMKGIEAQVSWTPRENFRLLVGGDLVHKSVESRLDRPYLDGRSSHQSAAFIEANYKPIAWLDLVAGGREDWHSEFHSQFSPRVSALAHFAGGKGSTRLSYGTAFRAPTFTEIYFSKEQFPDTEVTPESLKTFEVGASYQLSFMKLSATAFRSAMSDRIVFERVSGKVTYRNVPGEATARGVEVEADAVATKNVRIYTNYTFQDTRSDDEADVFKENQVYAPKHKVQSGIILSFRRLEGSLAGYWVGEQRDYFFKYGNPPVPSYTALFARVGWRPHPKALVGVTVKNLFDSRYFDKNGQFFDTKGKPITDALTLRPNYNPPLTVLADVRITL